MMPPACDGLLRRLDDPQANSLSALLTTTFKFRLPEIQDRAQHAAFLSSGGSSGGSLAGREAMGEFSAGMEGEERERECTHWSCCLAAIPSC